MESAKINASKVSQMTKHYSIGINGTTGNDLALDSNGDGSLNILLPEGAIVTAVHVGGSFTNGSGTSQLQAGKTSDTDSLFAAAATTDLEGTADAGGSTPGGKCYHCWGTVDAADNYLRIEVVSASAAPSAGTIYVWADYRFEPNIVWAQADLA